MRMKEIKTDGRTNEQDETVKRETRTGVGATVVCYTSPPSWVWTATPQHRLTISEEDGWLRLKYRGVYGATGSDGEQCWLGCEDVNCIRRLDVFVVLSLA